MPRWWTSAKVTPPPPRRWRLVREGKAELLMKGSLHSDEILGAVVAKEGGCAPAGA